MARIVALLGSVTPPGRLTSAITGTLERASAAGHSTELLDPGQLSLPFAGAAVPAGMRDDSARLLDAISGADAVLLASPVYRATMTGVMKNALDLLPVEALQGKPVGVVAMGATLHHFLGTESHMRDVLAWFGAFTMPTSVYLSSADFSDGKLTEGAAANLDALIGAMVTVAGAFAGKSLGPTPFAAASSRPKG